MTLSYRVHEAVKDTKGNIRGMRALPYIRMSRNGQIYLLQQGEFYTQGGKPVAETHLPDWVWDDLSKMSPDVLREARAEGLKKPEAPEED